MAPAHILMVAAENDSLVGGKVGGVGDVLRDIPTAIVQHPDSSAAVSVVVPSYGFLHRDATASRGTVTFQFGGTDHEAEVFVVPGRRPHDRIRQLVIHHPALSAVDGSGRHRIYVDDGSDRPFASDATRFALFCAAAAEALLQGTFDDERFGAIDQLHLHDWHASFLHVLRHFDVRYASLNDLPVAFTIHNLGLQGIRPLCGDVSSLTSWYPHLFHETDDAADRSDHDDGQERAESPSVKVVEQMPGEARTAPADSRDIAVLIDPDYRNCINPMAVAIRLSDRVHAVSPSYADEVCQASRPGRNDSACVFFGGEGLEGDLQQARDQGRLCGILNGCEYDTAPAVLPVTNLSGWMSLLDLLIADVQNWYARTQVFRHWLALQRLQGLRSSAAIDHHRPIAVFTSVTRVVDQKVRLLRGSDPGPSGRFEHSPLDQILSDRRCVYLVLGSGDAGYESFLDHAARRNPNLIFLNGFSLGAADALYEQGDLFLMPSAFEPCGISQMLAMRAGQPCVVHAIGGLKDTVHSDTGFSFSGDTPEALDRELVACVRQAVEMKASRAGEFQTLRANAIAKRFLWSDSIRGYFDRLYAK